MKKPQPNAKLPESPNQEQDDGLTHFRSAASRLLSRLAIVLVVLLLIDVGFILVETSATAHLAAELSQTEVADVTQFEPTATLTVRPAPSATMAPTRAPARATSKPKPAAPAVTSTVSAKAIPPVTITATAPPTVQTSAPVTPTATVSQSAQTTQSAAVDTCDDPAGQLVTDTINSKVLGHPLPVQVYLPPCYDGTHYTYPALYLIQGSGYNLGEWVDDGAPHVAELQMSLGMMPPFIIVMPGNDLSYGDSSVYLYSSRGKGSWEDFIQNELIPMVEAKYSAWPAREGRAIGGISRGGYWSLEIGFTHPDLFSAVGGHSPSITPDQLIGVPANFSMLSYVQSLDTLKTTRIFLDAGSTDWTQKGVTQLASDLDAKGVAYAISSGDGGHEDAYWASRMQDYLAFYSADWPRVARAKSNGASVATNNQGVQP